MVKQWIIIGLVTIADVAEAAGVSQATVSRVLNQHSNVSPGTYALCGPSHGCPKSIALPAGCGKWASSRALLSAPMRLEATKSSRRDPTSNGEGEAASPAAASKANAHKEARNNTRSMFVWRLEDAVRGAAGNKVHCLREMELFARKRGILLSEVTRRSVDLHDGPEGLAARNRQRHLNDLSTGDRPNALSHL